AGGVAHSRHHVRPAARGEGLRGNDDRSGRRPRRPGDAHPSWSGGPAAGRTAGAPPRRPHDRRDARLGHGTHDPRTPGAQTASRPEVARGRALSRYTDVRIFIQPVTSSALTAVTSRSTSTPSL